VLAGLRAGERVIVEGTQKVRDGASVNGTERAVDALPDETGNKSHEASAGSGSAASIAQ
jgi:hypothetical protein